MISKAEQRDHFESHSKNCKHCLQALKAANRIENIIAPAASLGVFALSLMKAVVNSNRNMKGRAWVWILIAVLSSTTTQFIGKSISTYIKKLVIGPDDLDKVSAAQFVDKEKKSKSKK